MRISGMYTYTVQVYLNTDPVCGGGCRVTRLMVEVAGLQEMTRT